MTEYHYDWQVDLQASPEALWTFVADTNRFNHDTGLPQIEQVTSAAEVPPGKYRLYFSLLGQRVEWDEEPFEWVYPLQFGVVRDYRTMAGEDFGEILRVVPGCFALVGSANAAREAQR